MDEFDAIASGITSERFEAFGKAVQANPEWQAMHAERFPIVNWIVAGVSEEFSFAISAN